MGRVLIFALIFSSASGCGRYFPGAIRPATEAQQDETAIVQDDGTVLFDLGRLAISLRPMTDGELNRQLSSDEVEGSVSSNPYTFGTWKPVGDSYTPTKYTVFLLQVKNYEYPKVHIDPSNLELVSDSAHRRYPPVSLEAMLEYYRSQAQAYSGQNYFLFQRRRDELVRTLYPDVVVFSSQEQKGYVVFPTLPPDVRDFEVHVRDVALRFDYAGVPTETADLAYRFEREVFRGFEPPAELQGQ